MIKLKVMASNGLLNRALKGRCRMCLRVRNTKKYLKAVGEVAHGYATGYIWECHDVDECDGAATKKLKSETVKGIDKYKIKLNQKTGRLTTYVFIK